MTEELPTRNSWQEEYRENKGYSLIEVLIVVIVTTVGFLALINLQVATVHAIGAGKNVVEAANLAEHFVETLRAEALEWNVPGTLMVSNPTKFPYLHVVGNPVAGGGSNWITAYIPPDEDKRVGVIGYEVVFDSGIHSELNPEINKRYCLHYRLTWLVPDYLIRADVRVSWMRDNANISLYQNCPPGMETDLANVSSVTVPGTIMRNVFAQLMLP